MLRLCAFSVLFLFGVSVRCQNGTYFVEEDEEAGQGLQNERILSRYNIHLYKDVGFKNELWVIEPTIPGVCHALPTHTHRQVSSLKYIGDGARVAFFEGVNCKGASLVATGSISDLRGYHFNDRAVSYKRCIHLIGYCH